MIRLGGGRAAFGVGRWHTVALRMRGDRISAVLDGTVLGTVTSGAHTVGNVGFRVSGWQQAQFDDVAVTPTAPAPTYVPQREITVTATAEHARVWRGDRFVARYVADDRPESFWHSGFAGVTMQTSTGLGMFGLSLKPPEPNSLFRSNFM